MKTEVIGHSAFQSVRVELGAGEKFISEAGKMVRMSASINSEVQAVGKSGGMMGGLWLQSRSIGGLTGWLRGYC